MPIDIDDEELQRILDQGSAYGPADDAEAFRRTLGPGDFEGDMPKGTRVSIEPEVSVPPRRVIQPRAAVPEVPAEKVVQVSGSPTDDFELAAAKQEDRMARSREAFERGTRQLIGGLTQTKAIDSTPGPVDAVAQLYTRRKAKDATHAQNEAGRLGAAKLNYDTKENARKAALDEQRRKEDLDERAKDNERSERGIDATTKNTAAMMGMRVNEAKLGHEEHAAKSTADLRREFNQLPDVKQFGEVDAAYQKVKGAASEPSAAGDLSAIFAYMKMLDPGSSVREGEFANAQNAAGIDQKIVGKYNQIMKGERLSPEQRADFINQAEKLYQTHRTRYAAQVERYRTLAERSGASPDDIVGALPSVSAPKRKQAKLPDGSIVQLSADGKSWEPVK